MGEGGRGVQSGAPVGHCVDVEDGREDGEGGDDAGARDELVLVELRLAHLSRGEGRCGDVRR